MVWVSYQPLLCKPFSLEPPLRGKVTVPERPAFLTMVEVYPPMESVYVSYDLTDSPYRQAGLGAAEHADRSPYRRKRRRLLLRGFSGSRDEAPGLPVRYDRDASLRRESPCYLYVKVLFFESSSFVRP